MSPAHLSSFLEEGGHLESQALPNDQWERILAVERGVALRQRQTRRQRTSQILVFGSRGGH
jgi:hypothetical protein